MVIAGTGCKNENAPEDKTAQTRHLIITMNDNTASQQRIAQATITDEGSTLLGEWTARDEVSYCNLSRTSTPSEDVITGKLTATSTGVKSDLEGDVNCTAGDYLAIVYPAADMSASTYTPGDGVHGKFTISLAGQDGSLSTLATHYHYVYGRAHVDAVTGTTATATMDKMESLLTVCKFSFVDKNAPDIALPIHTLTISYGGSGSDAGKYPQTATVEVTNLMTNEEAQAEAVTGSTEPLTINAGGATEVYVALLPTTASRMYNFIVTNANGSYNGTAEALLKKGEYVIAANLKLAANL